MITFHEGLPRSGKSYEAMVGHIIPNVKKGRKVFAYIEGINHEKIAELTDKTVEEVQQLVVQVKREDVEHIYGVIENDSFVIIDELQNFWPAGRQKLEPEITQFVTEHGHRGLDILCMGQSLADCHNLWKRRTEVKMTFTKLSAVGKSNSYKWEALRGQLKLDGNVKYTKIRSGVKKYEHQYFGSYKSHTDGTENTDDYVDDRTNIFKSNGFKYGLPLAFGVAIYALYHLVGFFSGADIEKNVAVASQPTSKTAGKTTGKTAAKAPIVLTKTYVDYFDEVISKNKARLTGNIKHEHYTEFFIDVLDRSYHKIERFTNLELTDYGWKTVSTNFGLIISKKGAEHLIRDWPMDAFGTVNDTVTPELSN